MPASNIIWINGSELAQLLEDVPATLEFNDKGIANASLTYQTMWDNAPALVRELKVHPDFSWLTRKSATITREEANMARVVVKFEGVDPSDEKEGEPEGEFSIEASVMSSPIASHPKFSEFAGTWDAPKKEGDVVVAIFEPVDNSKPMSKNNWRFKEFVPPSDKAGISTYNDPSIVVTESRTYSHQRTEEVQAGSHKIGEIDTPPNSSLVPTFSGRTYLATSMSVRKVGKGMTISRSWLLSGRRGWDTDIYDEA